MEIEAHIARLNAASAVRGAAKLLADLLPAETVRQLAEHARKTREIAHDYRCAIKKRNDMVLNAIIGQVKSSFDCHVTAGESRPCGDRRKRRSVLQGFCRRPFTGKGFLPRQSAI